MNSGTGNHAFTLFRSIGVNLWVEFELFVSFVIFCSISVMNNEAQKQKAESFRKLHRGDSILVLPNAWDCLSATIFEQAGFPALATTSGGVASVLGYPDGQQIPSRLMLGMVGRISSVVSVPVTADLEAGYGRTPAQIAQTIINAIELGIVGINFEDGTGDKDLPLRDIEEQVDLIKTIRKAAEVTQF